VGTTKDPGNQHRIVLVRRALPERPFKQLMSNRRIPSPVE
jgi:hypothetical protein